MTPEPGVPYAELWLGAHPKAPSQIELPDGTLVPLDTWIAAHPVAMLGQAVFDRFGGLPFLFKVLSAGESLSIQAHPTKDEAELLHAKDPVHYPDDNHKPEIAIALDGLAALIGFKPFAELASTLARSPEIAGFVGDQVVAQIAGAGDLSTQEQTTRVRELFAALIMNAAADPAAYHSAVDALAARLEGQPGTLSEAESRFLELRRQYGSDDVGLFALFLFNIAHLAPGEGLYTQAGVPHAYLKGNIIECMANSDNVVRVGLTPKFRDAETLLRIVDATPRAPEVLTGERVDDACTVYETPAAEFEMRRWSLPANVERTMTNASGPAILLVVKGQVDLTWHGGQEVLRTGDAVFIPACLDAYSLRTGGGAEVFEAAVGR